MLKRYHHIVGGVFRTVDALVMGLVGLASYGIRFYIPIIGVTKGQPNHSKELSIVREGGSVGWETA